MLGRVQGRHFALFPLHKGQRLRGEKGGRGGRLHVRFVPIIWSGIRIQFFFLLGTYDRSRYRQGPL